MLKWRYSILIHWVRFASLHHKISILSGLFMISQLLYFQFHHSGNYISFWQNTHHDYGRSCWYTPPSLLHIPPCLSPALTLLPPDTFQRQYTLQHVIARWFFTAISCHASRAFRRHTIARCQLTTRVIDAFHILLLLARAARSLVYDFTISSNGAWKRAYSAGFLADRELAFRVIKISDFIFGDKYQ